MQNQHTLLVHLHFQSFNSQVMQMQVPLSWQVIKVKQILLSSNYFPNKQINIGLFYEQKYIPLHATFEQLNNINKNNDILHLSVKKIQDNFNRQQDTYYFQKITPLIQALNKSPFAPVLHPAYNQIVNQINFRKQILKQSSKINIQFIKNNLQKIKIQRQNRQPINQQPLNNQNNNNNFGLGFIGMNLGGAFGGGILQRILTFVILGFQIIFIYKIGNYALTHLQSNQFIFLIIILILFFIIKSLNKRKQIKKVQENNDQQYQLIRNGPQSQLHIVLSYILLGLFSLFQMLLSYLMSLFPVWNQQTHENVFGNLHVKLNKIINDLRYGPQIKVQKIKQQKSQNFIIKQDNEQNEVQNNSNIQKQKQLIQESNTNLKQE